MPEIIEAEITRQKLAPALKGRRVLKFNTDWPRGFVSEEKDMGKAVSSLGNSKITGISRMGKVVVVNMAGKRVLAIHQRMSGHVALSDDATTDKHSHFVFELDNSRSFALVDPRKFGVVWYGSEKWFQQQPYIKKLGPDALKIEKEDFAGIFKNSPRSSVKSLLLKQDKIAGLGNIACDEILWHARIHPARKASDLEPREAKEIYKSMRVILADLLKYGGTSMSDWFHPDGAKGTYQDNFKVYKQKCCKRCGSAILYTKISGRGTYTCPRCQD